MDMLTDDFQGCPLPGGIHKFYFQKTSKEFEPVLPTDAHFIDELVYKLIEYGTFACNCTQSMKIRVNGKGL